MAAMSIDDVWETQPFFDPCIVTKLPANIQPAPVAPSDGDVHLQQSAVPTALSAARSILQPQQRHRPQQSHRPLQTHRGIENDVHLKHLQALLLEAQRNRIFCQATGLSALLIMVIGICVLLNAITCLDKRLSDIMLVLASRSQ